MASLGPKPIADLCTGTGDQGRRVAVPCWHLRSAGSLGERSPTGRGGDSERRKSQRQLQPELLWRKRVNGKRERRRGDGEGREREGDVRASVHRNGDGEAREQETLARLRTGRSEEATREFKAAAAATRVGHSYRPLDYSYECAKASKTSLARAWKPPMAAASPQSKSGIEGR